MFDRRFTLTRFVIVCLLFNGGLIWLVLRDARIHEPARERARATSEAWERRKALQGTPAADPTADRASNEGREQLVEDPAGKLLWISPTEGQPIPLAYVPAGTQCLVHLRPAALAAHPEGEKALAALGPWGAGAVAQLESLTGASLAEINAVLVSVVVARDGSLDACLKVMLLEPWSDAELARRRSDARPHDSDGRAYLADGDRAWFLAPAVEGNASRPLIVCPAAMVEELIQSEGAPLLARDIESLVDLSDADRTATVILSAKFLAAGGLHLVEGEAAPLRDALAALLRNDATAAALSIHWGDSFFVELRATPALSNSPRWLATTLRSRVAEGGEGVAAAIESQTWPDYGGQVLARFPAMLGKLVEFTRCGEANRHAVLRAYLPATAGHNLLMGAELLLTQSAGQHAHEDVGMAPQRSIEDRLATLTSLAFPKETLQRALELLAEDIGVTIAIDGSALQAEGITQNQSLALDLHDRPAGEILVEILRLANPDRTAEGPSDPRQKLVYLVDPAAEGGGRMIVTTRAAARKSGLALPAVFGGWGE